MSMSAILEVEIEYTYSDDRLSLLNSLCLCLLDQIRQFRRPRAYLRRGNMASGLLECLVKVVQPYCLIERRAFPSQHKVHVIIGAAVRERHSVLRNSSYLSEVVQLEKDSGTTTM